MVVLNGTKLPSAENLDYDGELFVKEGESLSCSRSGERASRLIKVLEASGQSDTERSVFLSTDGWRRDNLAVAEFGGKRDVYVRDYQRFKVMVTSVSVESNGKGDSELPLVVVTEPDSKTRHVGYANTDLLDVLKKVPS